MQKVVASLACSARDSWGKRGELRLRGGGDGVGPEGAVPTWGHDTCS